MVLIAIFANCRLTVLYVCRPNLDFLSSDVMHGEGNLLAHLAIIGYKVAYEQVGVSFCSMSFRLYSHSC